MGCYGGRRRRPHSAVAIFLSLYPDLFLQQADLARDGPVQVEKVLCLSRFRVGLQQYRSHAQNFVSIRHRSKGILLSRLRMLQM